MSNHCLLSSSTRHEQPTFCGTTPSENESTGSLTFKTSGSYASVSSRDQPMNESDLGRSDDISDTVMEVGSITDSEISTLYPHESISQRGGCIEHSSAPSEGENESVPDVHSFNSDNEDTLFKKLHGRAFTSQSDDYMLPADDREHSRLDLQHNVLKFHLRSLYPYPRWVERLLRPDQERQPAVLDIGTGSGRWAVEMALQFPHIEVLGIDLVPPVLLDIDMIPYNCRFEVDDANLSMAHHKDCFDVVQVRCADQGINDYNGFLYEVAQTIRPHGILILCMGDGQFFTEDLVPFPVTEPGEEGNSSTTSVKRFIIVSLMAKCFLPPISRWLHSNPNYENIQLFDYYIPIGAWKQGLDETETWVAEALKIDMMHVFEAFKPLLLTSGFSAEQVDRAVKFRERQKSCATKPYTQ
ncbi:hypothetical protein FRB97_008816 [Tulasnella sp. 331]|nr:hypothetical protein FRB97_008816 [Tulasnella sp. 331]